MATRKKTQTLIQQSRAVSPQEKAIYHVVTGAGRARVVRDFFNLGPGDEDAIVRLLQGRMTTRLASGRQ